MVEIIALGHEFVHGFTTFEQILQVLVDHLLHLLELVFDSEELVSFKRVLPLSQVDLKRSELKWVVSGQDLVKDTSGLELVPELHDKFVEQRVGSTLVVFVVSDSRGRDSVQGDPAMALANVVLQRD